MGIGRPCALALAALGRLQLAATFYDAMDNFPEFHRGLSRWAVRRHEDAVAAKVNLIVASSTFLAEKFARRGLRVEKVSNACEYTRPEGGRAGEEGGRRKAEGGSGPSARNGRSDIVNHSSPIPNSQSPIACCPPSALCPPSSSPVLGYLGCIAHWFDWPLVIRLAETFPQMRIELVGPCTAAPPERLPANVRLLPACQQSHAAGHLARFRPA